MINEVFDDSLAYLDVYLENGAESRVFQKPECLNNNALSKEFIDGLERLKNRLEVNDYHCEYEFKVKITATKSSLMPRFKKLKLSKLCTKIGSGSTPRGGDAVYKTKGISLIRSQNILDFTFSTNGLAFIDDTQAKELNNVTLQERDVLMNITGDSVARVSQVPNDILPARVNQHVAIILGLFHKKTTALWYRIN